MSALFILFVLAVWCAVLYNVGYYLFFFIQPKWLQRLVAIMAVFGLSTLAFWDELKGKEEFELLCKAGGVYQIAPNAFGKKFYLNYNSSNEMELTGYIRPVYVKNITYTDRSTGEVIATAKAYLAKGGWLSRRVGIPDTSGGSGPLLGRSQCFPDDSLEQVLLLREITNQPAK
jgi:hypothetical protein